MNLLQVKMMLFLLVSICGVAESSCNGHFHDCDDGSASRTCVTGIRRGYSDVCPQTAYVFPRKSATDFIRVKTPIRPIDEFSFCTWATVYGTGRFVGSILSYSTLSDSNAVLVLFESNGKLNVHVSREDKVGNVHPLAAGTENHLCFALGRTAGFMKIYYNGSLHTRLSFSNRNPIPTGGPFIIGQDQDSPVGLFDATQALHGEIRNYMTWDRILSDEEVLYMYQEKCHCAAGHAMALSTDHVQLHGAVNALYIGNECC